MTRSSHRRLVSWGHGGCGGHEGHLGQHPQARDKCEWAGGCTGGHYDSESGHGNGRGLWGQPGQGCWGTAPCSPPCVPCPVTSPHANANRSGQEAPLTSSCRLRRFPGTSALIRVPVRAPAPTVPHSSPLTAPWCLRVLLPMPAVSLSPCHRAKSSPVPAWHFPKPGTGMAAGLGRPRGCPCVPWPGLLPLTL